MFHPKKEILATEKYIHRDQSCRIINYFDKTGLKAYIVCEYGIICHTCIPVYWHKVYGPQGSYSLRSDTTSSISRSRKSLRLIEKKGKTFL